MFVSFFDFTSCPRAGASIKTVSHYVFLPLPYLPHFQRDFAAKPRTTTVLDLPQMSSRTTSQLPSFSLVIEQAEHSNVVVTVHLRPIIYHDPQTPNVHLPTATTTTTTVPSQPHPVGVSVNTSSVSRVDSIMRRALQTLGARLRGRRDT